MIPLGDMSWMDFEQCAHGSYAILPVGAVEPHGPHLPLGADNMISEFFASGLAEALDGLVLPLIGYGVATPPVRLGGEFPGIIGISGSTLMQLMADVMVSLAKYGVGRYVIVNSAIDNVSFLCEAARVFRNSFPDSRVMVINWWDVVGEDFRNDLARETGVDRQDDHHAAMVESSLVMHISPDTVKVGVRDSGVLSDVCSGDVRRMRYHIFPLPSDATTESGIVYRADKASAEIGGRVARRALENMAAAVRLEFER